MPKIFHARVGGRDPRGPTRDFHKPQIFVEFYRPGIIVAYMQPDGGCVFFVGVCQGAFCEGAGDAASPVVGVGRHVCNEMDAFAAIAEWDQTGITDYLFVLLPDVACQRQGGGICHAIGPTQKA